MILIILSLLRFLLWPKIHDLLDIYILRTYKKMCILLLFEEVVYKQWLNSVEWCFFWVSSMFLLVIGLVLSITKIGLLKPPTIMVNLSFNPLSLIIFCYTYFVVLLFASHTFRIFEFSWINLFISMSCPSLCLIIFSEV